MDNPVLDMLRESREGYHPLLSLLELSDDIDASVADKISAHKEIAKYVLPQLKAVETKLDINSELGAIRIVIDNGEDDKKDLKY